VTALVASGLPAERWRFVGFLPRRHAELDELLAHSPETLVAFESPRRLAATLALIAARDELRAAAVCRELTKLHEEVRRGAAGELAEHYRTHPARGEIVLVLGGSSERGLRREEALAALRELISAGARKRPAAAAVAKLTGMRANELYRELTSDGQ
jgi:16S rRNA (cytidine1402-2'-O)-methyltransferase